MPKRKAEKDLCTEQISFRCTKKEKLWIKKNAGKKGIQQKELIMESIKYYTRKGRQETGKQVNQAACACEVQRLINCLKRDDQNDSYIKEVCKKLWDLVN